MPGSRGLRGLRGLTCRLRGEGWVLSCRPAPPRTPVSAPESRAGVSQQAWGADPWRTDDLSGSGVGLAAGVPVPASGCRVSAESFLRLAESSCVCRHWGDSALGDLQGRQRLLHKPNSGFLTCFLCDRETFAGRCGWRAGRPSAQCPRPRHQHDTRAHAGAHPGPTSLTRVCPAVCAHCSHNVCVRAGLRPRFCPLRPHCLSSREWHEDRPYKQTLWGRASSLCITPLRSCPLAGALCATPDLS